MAKQVKSEVAIDRISDLPDLILSHILSFLPFEYAVQTSILAPRWRYLFFSMSEIHFDFDYLCLDEENLENFKNFFDRLLFSPKHLNLQRFTMKNYQPCYDESSRLDGWLCAALRRGVKEIELKTNDFADDFVVFPTLLLTSRSLVTLKLDIVAQMKVPANVCLPNLKTLLLRYIEFSDGGSFQRLLSNCIVLEVLVFKANRFTITGKLCIQSLSLKKLKICQTDTSVEVIIINAPKLVSFHCEYEETVDYSLSAINYSLSAMNSLQQARIVISEFDHAPDLTHLFRAICNVQSLRLLIRPDVVRVSLPAYYNLVELEFDFDGDDQVVWLVGFLHHTPCLKKLILHSDEKREVDYEFLPKEVPSCLLFHLKEIVLLCRDCNGPIWSLDLIKFFLSHALILEKFMIETKIPKEEERLSISEELLRFPRNSKKCQIKIS